MGMEPLGVAQHQTLTEEYPLEGPQQIQVGNIHRPAFLHETKSQLTHGSTPLPSRYWPRSRSIGSGSRGW